MNINQLELINFRNHKKQKWSFSSGISIIIGRNAAGKTNLMEAIYLLSVGKSFRSGRDMQVITFGEEIAKVKGEVGMDGDSKDLEIMITGGKVMGMKTPLKKYLINDVARRSTDFAGTLKCVLFWPEDMELVTDSPFSRRHYLDYVLIQTDGEYRRTQISYERGLRQRNKLLEDIREGKAHEHQLLFWDQLLSKQGGYITRKRGEFIESTNGFKLPKLEERNVKYRLVYDKSVITQLRLEQYRQAELGAGVTLIGPHRDNFIFQKEEGGEYMDLSSFGSRGEQRLAVLWLKLAELNFVKNSGGENPVLLLDDIFSELDRSRREIIFSIIGKQQSILTVTDRHMIPEKYYKGAKVVELK